MGLAVSFYGGSKETFEAVTQVPGSYERVLDGLKYAVSRKIRVRMKTPVISSNLCTLDKMKELARELKIAYRYTPMISPKDDGSKETLVHRLSDDEMRTFLRGEKKENLSHRPKDPDTPLCTAARAQVTISPVGEVYPCVQLRHSGGNIRQRPFGEIWKSDVFEAYRKISLAHLENCTGCRLLAYCVPCVGFAEIEHGSYKKAPAEYCRLASLKREIDLEKK
jgi:radical SAM protein with 4Fe4S-binding SPASM domain